MQPGDMVSNRFEIERLAGAGGMGKVFRARDRASGELVAVKVLLAAGADEMARFEQEARVLSELSHPGIVRYVAHGITTAGEPYLAMEWLEGEDLMSRLMRTGLTMTESIRLATQVAGALGAAHARGIIHRDLKPTNLLLSAGDIDQVKLLDFGIARPGGMARMTHSGMLVGTPGYMAPEQARTGEPLDARADVFSLGCVLFECLTGTPAFTGSHRMAIFAKILFEEPPRVREVRPEIPDDLDILVTRMLAKQPEHRPGDGTAVAEALATLGTDAACTDIQAAMHTRPIVLTGGEQRILSLVLVGGDRTATVQAPTLGKTMASRSDDALRREAKAYSGRLEHLADGSVAVTISGAGVATDQAAQAARCAMALRQQVHDRRAALVTGRVQATGRVLLGDAIDRAVEMLSMPVAPGASAHGAATPVAIDEITSSLLDARFDIRETDGGLWLWGERELLPEARTLLGKATACVGRDLELSMLEQWVAECVEEPVAQVVLVTAAAGMGKSRLAHELLRSIRRRDDPPCIWIGRGDSLKAGSAFGLLGQALRGACAILDSEPLQTRRDKLRARVGRHVAAADERRISEFLGEMIGTPLPDDHSLPLRAARKDAELMREQMRRAWEDFLDAESSRHPILILLEDMQWGDLPTIQFIDHALRQLHDRPWMVLALARPEVHDLFPKLWAGRATREIQLKPLTRRAAERLVWQVLGQRLDAGTTEQLIARADGNAFYLEELIRAASEGKGAKLPQTVVAMVQSRLEWLDSDARRVLRAASVFGEVFWPGAVGALLGGASQSTRINDCLSSLLASELLTRHPESRFSGEQELAFRHTLFREGAYAMLTDDDRVLGHRLAGQWLEQHGETDAFLLAEHFEHGGDPARAGTFFLRAAEHAMMGGDVNSAAARAARGLHCDVPEELRIALLAMLCETGAWRAQWTTAEPYAGEVMSHSTAGSVPWTRAALVKLYSVVQRGKTDELVPLMNSLKDTTFSPEAIGYGAHTLATGVYVLDLRGQLAEAEAIYQRMQAMVASVAKDDAVACAWLSNLCAYRAAYAREDPWAGLLAAETAEAQFREAGHRRATAMGQLFAGMNLWLLGALPLAECKLRETLRLEENEGDLSSIQPFCLSAVLSESGLLDEALLHADGLVEFGQARRRPIDEGRGRWARATVLHRKGALDSAEGEALTALDLLARSPLDHMAATAALAALHLALGRTAEAQSGAARALASYESLGACGFFRGAMLRLVHAECLHAVGDVQAARNAIVTARERLLSIAAKIADPQFRKSFIENVPENARTIELAQQW